ncbi:MAG: NAD(P)H-quinone oxidoreductase [Gammaproteobacteria bacterium]|nr:NAD(P)H-quinone oxidoreductase [Gammaproteobacteria bacterium]
MRVAEIRDFGGPEGLAPATRDTPSFDADEVLVRVQAAGVNRPDVMQRQGNYPPPPGASDIPGLEIAGTVVAVGSAVSDIAVGDEVCALVAGGGYAEYCAASAALCLTKPADFSMAQAAALPETFFTVWTNVFERGRLSEGEALLVHGGSSGIGTTAILLGKAFGAEVYVTAGSESKCDACVALGADAAINYKTEDFVERVAQLTRGRGVDVLLDMVGGAYFPKNVKCMADEGRIVQIAVQQGLKTELNLLAVMSKRLTVTGSTLRPRPVAAKAAIAAALRERVWPKFGAELEAPPVFAEFPLAQASAAHALMESSAHIGKIVLTM